MGKTNQTLTGPLALNLIDRDTLRAGDGQWTDELGHASPVQLLLPLQRMGSNYIGVLKFPDGLPASSSPHHRFWTVRIADGDDVDGNGIPDFSDTLTAA